MYVVSSFTISHNICNIHTRHVLSNRVLWKIFRQCSLAYIHTIILMVCRTHDICQCERVACISVCFVLSTLNSTWQSIRRECVRCVAGSHSMKNKQKLPYEVRKQILFFLFVSLFQQMVFCVLDFLYGHFSTFLKRRANYSSVVIPKSDAKCHKPTQMQ